MAGEHPTNWRLPMHLFHAFRDDRPKEEKWELIDGRPTMMAPPTLVHQRICRNISTVLNQHLDRFKPEWAADGEVGLLLPGDDEFNPEPDVTVIDRAVTAGQIYAERFYIVVEVLSPNDKAWVLTSKIRYYTSHAHCMAVMFIEQAEVRCRLLTRKGEVWSDETLAGPTAQIVLPMLGDIGTLARCYRDTPLATAAPSQAD